MANGCTGSIQNTGQLRRHIASRGLSVEERITNYDEVFQDESERMCEIHDAARVTQIGRDVKGQVVRTMTFEDARGVRKPHDKVVAHYFDHEDNRLATVEGTYGSMRRLEEKVETIGEVLRSPLEGAFAQGMRDLSGAFDHIYSEGHKWKKDLSALVGFGALILPHELLHAGMNFLLGGRNEKILINTLWGGKIWEYLVPGVTSEVMFPFIGGRVVPEGEIQNLPLLHAYAVSLAPYVLTPLGIYAAKKARDCDSKLLAYLGAGAIATHCGGMFGDFTALGVLPLMKKAQYIDQARAAGGLEWTITATAAFAMLPVGIYCGWKGMSFTYRVSKAMVNTLMRPELSEKVEQIEDEDGLHYKIVQPINNSAK